MTGNPIDEFKPVVNALGLLDVSVMKSLVERKQYPIVGIIDSVNVRISQKSQRKYALVRVSNGRQTIRDARLARCL